MEKNKDKFKGLIQAAIQDPSSSNISKAKAVLSSTFFPANASGNKVIGLALQKLFAIFGIKVFANNHLSLSTMSPAKVKDMQDSIISDIVEPVYNNYKKALDTFGVDKVPPVFDIDGVTIFNNAGVNLQEASPFLKIIKSVVAVIKKAKANDVLKGLDIYLKTGKKMKGVRTLGLYSVTYDNLSVKSDRSALSRTGRYMPEVVMLHELGHRWFYKNLPHSLVADWSQEYPYFYTSGYSATNSDEAFAEMFAYALINSPSYKDIGVYKYFIDKYILRNTSMVGSRPDAEAQSQQQLIDRRNMERIQVSRKVLYEETGKGSSRLVLTPEEEKKLNEENARRQSILDDDEML